MFSTDFTSRVENSNFLGTMNELAFSKWFCIEKKPNKIHNDRIESGTEYR